MCGEEFHHDGLSHEDFKEIAQAMCETGLIDLSVWWAPARHSQHSGQLHAADGIATRALY